MRRYITRKIPTRPPRSNRDINLSLKSLFDDTSTQESRSSSSNKSSACSSSNTVHTSHSNATCKQGNLTDQSCKTKFHHKKDSGPPLLHSVHREKDIVKEKECPVIAIPQCPASAHKSSVSSHEYPTQRLRQEEQNIQVQQPVSCKSQLGLKKNPIVRKFSVERKENRFIDTEINLRYLHNVVASCLDNEEYDDAIEALEELLKCQKERFGISSRHVGISLHLMGQIHMRAGYFDDAFPICQEALRVRIECLGPLNEEVADSFYQIGIVAFELEELEQACDFLHDALMIRRRKLGRRHSQVVPLLCKIGSVLIELKQFEEAKLLYEEASDIQRTQLGSQSKPENILLSIAISKGIVGSINFQQGKYDQALVSYEEALLLQQSVLGDIHQTVLNTIKVMACINKHKLALEGNTYEDFKSQLKCFDTSIENHFRPAAGAKKNEGKPQFRSLFFQNSNPVHQPLADEEDKEDVLVADSALTPYDEDDLHAWI